MLTLKEIPAANVFGMRGASDISTSYEKMRHWAELKRNIGYSVIQKPRKTEVHN
jgi:hypothetical protein